MCYALSQSGISGSQAQGALNQIWAPTYLTVPFFVQGTAKLKRTAEMDDPVARKNLASEGLTQVLRAGKF